MATATSFSRASVALYLGLSASMATSATVPNGRIYLTNVEEITSRIAQTEERKHLDLQDYSGTRRYILRNSHLGRDAILTVRFSYRKGQGKTYQVIDAQNAEGMGRRILDRVLEAEVDASRPGHHENGGVTPAHYDFQLLGMESHAGHLCYVMGVRPKSKSKYLLQGKAWIDARDFALVKLEGRPTVNLSFWVGKPLVVQEFEKVGDFWMASRNSSHSDSRLLGKAELTIEYTGYQVKGVEGTRVASQPLTSRRILE